jgi:linoleoyl-CoA desaturase
MDNVIPALRTASSTEAAIAAAELRPKFPPDQTGFHSELRNRVDAYFETSGRKERDCWQMYLKVATVFAWYVVSYVLLVFVATSWWQAIPLAFSLAFAMAAIGFNIQHDGGHSAISRYRWVNKIAAMSLDLIGASSYLWHWKHVIFHHTYVNITGVDADIEIGKLVRFSPHQKRSHWHRWQHVYLWPLYGIMASRWHLMGDFQDIYNGKIGPHSIPRPKGLDLAIFIVGKLTSVCLLLAMPMFFHDWWVVVLYYILVTGVIGMTLSIVFQLAHCVEEAEFPLADTATHRLEDTWAMHQVKTTVDFSRDSKVISWLLGGLNFQIEHHLFPRVCHTNYPALSRIVEKTCQEYGVKYSVHPTFGAGLRSHYQWLHRMGHTDFGIYGHSHG